MASRYSSPSYESLQTFYDTDDDWPGPRSGHTLTAIFANKLVLFGGSTSTVAYDDSSLPTISLEGVTNLVHCFDVLTRKWTRLNPGGDVPSPRACHAAASLGTLLIIQGGIGLSGPSDGDVYMLDLSSNDLKWLKLMFNGVAPGPRFGHVMDIVHEWLVIFGGKNGNEILSDTWALNTRVPFVWVKLNPYGNHPSARMFASAGARADGVFLLSGGRDHLGMALGDTHALKMDSIVECAWTSVPGLAPSPRYQHTAVFEDLRMHVFGGALNRARLIDGEAIAAVLDTETGLWFYPNGPETYTSGSNRHSQYQLTRRYSHAAASVGSRIYVHGGIRENVLLDDFLVAETSQPSSLEPEVPSFTRRSDIRSIESSPERLAEAYNLPTLESAFYDFSDQTGGYVPLPERAETVRGCLVSTGNLNRFANEGQQNNNSSEDLHKKVLLTLLRPKDWKIPAEREFFLSCSEVEYLCNAVEQIFVQEPTVLQLKVPIKVFGNLHGQFGDLMRLFREYGSPSVEGDITFIDYLFLGDYVDQGKHSLETIMLLLALKIEYPKNIHLIRGDHEYRVTNRFNGFLSECKERMGQADGLQAWLKINRLFNYLPLGAVIEDRILCIHGGIGRTVSLEDIASIWRPAFPELGSTVLKDILWSGPTENDSVLGIQPNARGEGFISFGPDVVKRFCERNKLDMIIRSHECVANGYKRFAQGRLITVFSATNYCGVVKNAGAILVIGRDFGIYPRLIHPHPPLISSSQNPPDREWMQELNVERLLLTPARGLSQLKR